MHPRCAPRFGLKTPLVSPRYAALLLSTVSCICFLFVTSAHAISSRTLIAPTGAAVSDQFGYSVAPAGDVNGDGFADVIVGAIGNDAAGVDAGRAYVYYGGPGADAVPDLTLTGEGAGHNFGDAVAAAGDFNGDGYGDVIVGAPNAASSGRAYIYYGGPLADSVADLKPTYYPYLSAGWDFGAAVAGAGDVNGDGYDDVIVGAPAFPCVPPFFEVEGYAAVFYGGSAPDSIADWTNIGAADCDEHGDQVGGAGDVNGDGYDDFIVAAPANDAGGFNAGRAYFHFGGPSLNNEVRFTGAVAGDYFGRSVGKAGDVNGDGYDDLVIGTWENDAGGTNAGSAYIYFGGASFDTTADLVSLGAAANDYFGFSAGTAGDTNGDGYEDFIVSAHGSDVDGTDTGRAYLFFGGPGVDATSDFFFPGVSSSDDFGRSVATAGDVDGDGRDDVIVGARRDDAGGADAGRAYVFSLFPYQVVSPNGGEQWVAGEDATVRWQGHDVADLSISYDAGSSWSTLAVGLGGEEENEFTLIAPAVPTDHALVRLTYSGESAARSNSDASDDVFRIVSPVPASPARPVAARLFISPLGAAGADGFGGSVSSAGDVNGDGADDVLVGATSGDGAVANSGAAYLYLGGAAADGVVDLTLPGVAASDQFGASVASAGDIGHDGFDDLIVGAPFQDGVGANSGFAYVYLGSASPNATVDGTLAGFAAEDRFGQSVAAAGDVNGDGYGDFMVGAYLHDAAGTDAGRVYIYFGSVVVNNIADVLLDAQGAGDAFGIAVAPAGDLDQDGFADVVVGASLNDSNGTNAGRAYVFYGGAPMDAVADLVFSGAASEDRFGLSVASAGDANGDGWGDLVVGAPGNDAGGTNAGRAYVFFLGPGADTAPDVTITGVIGDSLGASVGPAGDVNRDGFDDLVVGARKSDFRIGDAGAAYVYFGGVPMDSLPDLRFYGEAATDFFGTSVAGAGDFTGDGFPDIVAGASFNDVAGGNAGRAYVYDIQRHHVLAPAAGTTWNVGASKSIMWSGAEPADVWLSVDGGRSFDLVGSDTGGEETNSLTLRVPHAPTRYARVKVTASDGALEGSAESDSLFTIQSTVSLLAFSIEAAPAGAAGLVVRWETNPGPEDLAGYRLERAEAGAPAAAGARADEWTTLVSLTRELSYHDASGAVAPRYRLFAVNGLGEELLLGETGAQLVAPLAAWPLPYRGGALSISFATAAALGGAPAETEVALYDVSGRRVRQIAGGRYAPGRQLASWDGADANGRPVSAGVYFLRATSGGYVSTIKMSVVR